MTRAAPGEAALDDEAAFLDTQAELARAALKATAQRFVHGLTSGARETVHDVASGAAARSAVDRFPLPALGAAIAAGLAAGMGLAKLRGHRGEDGADLTAAAGVAPAGIQGDGVADGGRGSLIDHLGRLARAIGLS